MIGKPSNAIALMAGPPIRLAIRGGAAARADAESPAAAAAPARNALRSVRMMSTRHVNQHDSPFDGVLEGACTSRRAAQAGVTNDARRQARARARGRIPTLRPR